MRIGIFSDIHGNIHAFEKVHRKLLVEGCDMHLFLGDICGYYYHQNEVIELMRTMPSLVTLAGNHDIMFMKAAKDDGIMRSYVQQIGRSYALLKEHISEANMAFLGELRESYVSEDGEIAAFHGSPWNPYHEYVYPDSNVDQFSQMSFRVVFLGHTHHPMDREINGKRLINPGSVGQPRNGGDPTYGVFNTETGVFDIKEITYDVQIVVEEVRQVEEYNAHLISVLEGNSR